MHYEEALRLWGARRLEERSLTGKPAVDPTTVVVRMEFNEGYTCCGGTNPNCYCSFAESPSANVSIAGTDVEGKPRYTTIDHDDFDFAAILGEIVAAAGGSLTSGTIDDRKD